MTRRRKIKIDDQIVDDNPDTTIRTALQEAGFDNDNLPPRSLSDLRRNF